MIKQHNYFIILIISIIISYYIYTNNNNKEKFSSQFENIAEIKKDCPVGNIMYGFCNNLCSYYNKEEEKEFCNKQCPPAVKKYLIDSPDNIYTNFLLKYIWKQKDGKVDTQLNEVQKYLIQQTEIAQAMQQLSNPGSKWKEIEKSTLDQSRNLEKHIQDNISDIIEKEKQLNILDKLKQSIINDIRAFHYTTDPTFNEISTIIPKEDSSKNEYNIDDKYSFWIEIDIEDSPGNISKKFFKPYNFKCYNRIDELLVENNFIKLNNKKLGYLWKIYDIKPTGTKISSTYNIRQFFKRKFNDIKPNRWHEFIKTSTTDHLTDTNNLDVIANNSAFISWLKLLISIKSPIEETNTFDSSNKKYIYQLALNEQKVITDLSYKAGISKFKFDNYIIVNEKYYRPHGEILLSNDDFDNTFTPRIIRNLNIDSYIEFNYNGNKLYLKIVPPLILNSDLKQKCNTSGYKNKDEYTKYNSNNIISKINEINNININQLNDVIIEKNNLTKLNTAQKILDALNSKYPDKDIYNSDSYFNKDEVSSLWSSWMEELTQRVQEEKERRERINNNCKYTDADVATWNSTKNIIDMGSGINYGQIKNPTENIADIDNYYIKNTNINTVNNEINDVNDKCAFNKTEVINWKNQKKIDLKPGLSYGQIKNPTENILDIDEYYIKNTNINTVNNQKNDVNDKCAFNKTDVINWKNQKKIDLKPGLSYGQIKNPTENILDIDEYYIKNTNITAKQNQINSACLLNKTKDWGNNIDISSSKYGKIKTSTNDGFLIKTDALTRNNYLKKKCHILNKDKNKWGKIGKDFGKYGKINTAVSPGEYGEIGVDQGKYGLIYEQHGGPYGLINTNDKCQPGMEGVTNCRNSSDYIPLNKCNTNFLSQKNKKITDTNSVLAKDIATTESIYKAKLTGMMDDWYRIDDAFCIFNTKKNKFDKCISDHKDGDVLSYSEFKSIDNDYKSKLQSQKQKAITDAIAAFDNKYKTGDAQGETCLPGELDEYTQANDCTHLTNGTNLKCKDISFDKTQTQLTNAISSTKDSRYKSIIDKGFDDNINSYANKYDNGNQCNPSTNVPEEWRSESSSCKDSGKICGSVCPTDNCPTGKSCIPKVNKITESQMDFESPTDLKQENTYKTAYDAAKVNWMGKYDDGSNCKPKDNVNPNLWKIQDSNDVCGGNSKCINVNNALDEINSSSNIANTYACKKLGRDTCKVMNQKYDSCVNKTVQMKCPAGKEPDTAKCNRTKGTTICKECPKCGSNQYRVDNGLPTKVDGKYKYCGTCKDCGTGKNIGKYEYIDGCNGLNSGTVKSCSGKKCPSIQVIVGCNKDGSPICENPAQCSSSQFRQGRTKTVKGTCTPKTQCRTNLYLNGFVKATSTTDGKNGTCKQCVACHGDQQYMSDCSGSRGPGKCLTMNCGNCSPGQIKLGCIRSSPSSNTFNPKCQTCTVGQRKDGNKCVPCPIGKYSSSSGATNCTPCNTCTDLGLKTNNCKSPGSNKDNVCHNKPNCSSGKYASIGNPPSCNPCPANTQQPTSNNNDGISSCLTCNNTEYSSAGSTRCLQRNCDANHYLEPKTGGGAVCKSITSNLCPSTCGSNQIKTGCKKQSATTNMQRLNAVQTNCVSCTSDRYKVNATTCGKKICPCPSGGTRSEGTECPTHGQIKCKTCNNGYVRGSGNTCVSKTCSCPNGTRTTGVPCGNGQNCSNCNRGYYLSSDKKRCVSNRCSCPNGSAKTGSNCSTHNAHLCRSCNGGFRLSSSRCYTNTCTCPNGSAKTGSNCSTHNAHLCKSCNGGFRLSSSKCYANTCTCTNGYAATGSACTTHKAHICKSCYTGKTLKNGKCVSPPGPPGCPAYKYYNEQYRKCSSCYSCLNGHSTITTCPNKYGKGSSNRRRRECTTCYSGYTLKKGECIKTTTPRPSPPPPPPSYGSYYSYSRPSPPPKKLCTKNNKPGRCGPGQFGGRCNRYAKTSAAAYCSDYNYCGNTSAHKGGSRKNRGYDSNSTMCAVAV